ncbi:MAG: DUF937 domain-containing protein [Rubricoccaceae bacterium]|nr:DUF937 domain-containing protein [Rubricoccaceae bacterium]
MNGILDLLGQHLGGSQLSQLASTVGADEQQTQKAVAVALPALLTAMNRNTNSTEGARSLDAALEKDHDGSLLDNLGGLFSGALAGRQADGAGILGHVLGGQRSTVEQGVSRASGLDLSQVQRLLPLLAPVVMAALGRQKRQGGLDAAGLSGLLGQEAQRARTAAPAGLLGALGGFLDQDGDGDFKDDLLKQGAGLLGGFLGKK